ncbi:MAG: hypothetical protein LDL33_09255 [Desulfomonile sp.]|nr:hypothetical protein [Desulfomonile sp.]
MSDGEKPKSVFSARGIIRRFAHLLSAQVAEGLGSALFFLYLAWVDDVLYGEVMYAVAAGVIVMKVVQFGLYYPLVLELGSAPKDRAPETMNRVNLIKLGLLIPGMMFVVGLALFKGFSAKMAWVLIFVSLGFGLEALAETFFADLRVRGLQVREARIKIAASLVSYGFGFVCAYFGLSPLVTSLFKIVSGILRLGGGIASYFQVHGVRWLLKRTSRGIWPVFRATAVFALIEILGIVYNRVNIFFLEDVTGVDGVADYSATYNIVDPLSVLASEQLLGWVIFPLLASLWWSDREKVGPLVRRTAQWLMALAFPAMFFLYVWSDIIIGTLYPGKFEAAAWMQRYLVWTILLSFESNLFCNVMMVAGAAKVLLAFSLASTVLCFVLNVTLVYPYGLAGACMVLIFTKLLMTVLTFTYCQVRFRFFRLRDFAFPVILASFSLGLFALLAQYILHQRAVLVAFAFYFLMLWRPGMRIIGRLPR